MGVTGLWQILQPCARPIKIETLNRKRLAVDASIWIYQFLKAVRDKEGNALRNSHVVGFFRRICKLLFFGIKPVFVFDGGAPALKRQTIRARKSRREGRREDAVRTAGKLLAVQMQRRAEEEEAQRKADRDRPQELEESVPDEGLVYVDELQMTQQERNQNRKFRKKDQYHLPELDMTMSEMGGPNDPRVMSLEDLQAHARSFETGEDINVYDFSKIDYDSPFFMSLPASDRYNILNAARLRSRLRMGHSKEQLDNMFPDRMAFSKFQIERVRERNELTQRLMNLNDYDAEAAGARIAGEKGREYVLVRNDGVEGGWALGVISEEGKQDKPIDIDQPAPVIKADPDADDDEDFEDVPIEGLNRLPKKRTQHEEVQDQLLRQRRAVYGSRRRATTRRPRPKKKRSFEQDPNSLFIQSSGEEEEQDDWEEAEVEAEPLGNDEAQSSEDEDLQRAIAMSMQKDNDEALGDEAEFGFESEEENTLEDFKQTAAKQAMPVPKGSARAIANILNKRAHDTAPESREITSFGVPTQKPDSSSDEGEDSMDLQAALKESRRTKRKTNHSARRAAPSHKPEQSATEVAKQAGFSGPLPFEKLDLGSSLLGKKKMQERTEAAQGGFENPALAPEKKKQSEPLPPWFSGNIEDDMEAQRKLELEDREKARQFDKQFTFQKKGESMLRRYDTGEVIDLDGSDDEKPTAMEDKIIDLDQDEVETTRAEGAELEESLAHDAAMTNAAGEVKMGDMADELRANPVDAIPSQDIDTVSAAPVRRVSPNLPGNPPNTAGKESLLQGKVHFAENADTGDEHKDSAPPSTRPPNGKAFAQARAPFAEDDGSEDSDAELASPTRQTALPRPPAQSKDHDDDEEILDWSDSDREDQGHPSPDKPEPSAKQMTPPVLASASSTPSKPDSASPAVVKQVAEVDDDDDLGFEDVEIPEASAIRERPLSEDEIPEEYDETQAQHSGLVPQESIPEGDEFDDFSDPEDAEMLRALTLEAEEHARFASTLNNKTQAQNVREYEVELKQLRNQQKKDRRDADEVTQIMIQECQSLLRLFGLPYITAPMEAEAQCAELVHLGLVDGIVTDDSDCFLFGGTRIYKNMFNQAKFVECYLTSDLEKEFDLTRDKLIAVAHLLGSDYTEGIPGIGPVSALEIISEFGNLENFKEWWNGVQLNTIPKEADANVPFRKKFRKNATKLFLPPAFPDERVKLAYLQPDVDADQETFQWGVPDLAALRSFLMATIGWSQERTDEVLVPVIKDMNRRMDEGTQANITAFFDGGVGIGAAGTSKGEAFAPRKRAENSGKRMGGALNRMAQRARVKRTGGSADVTEDVDDGGNEGEELPVVAMPDVQQAPQKKRKSAKKTAPPADASEEDASEFEGPKKKKAKRKSRATKSTGRRKKADDDFE